MRKIYLEAEKVSSNSSKQLEKAFVSRCPQWKELMDSQGKKIEAWEYSQRNELKRKIMADARKLGLVKVKSIKRVMVLAEIFKKRSKELGCSKGPCDWQASIAREILTELGYTAKVMRSTSARIVWYFVEFTDLDSGLNWIFDPLA